MTAPAKPDLQAATDDAAQLRAQLQAVQREQQSLEQQLAAARAGLADFASTVSHDLRANLRHINAFTGLLREELASSASADVKSFLDKLTESARLMGVQLEGLMALTQIDRASLNIEPLQMGDLIAQARQALASESAGRAVEWKIAADFPPVLGDAAMLVQVWSHLFSNALKFTAPRAPAVVEVGWQRDAGDGMVGFFVQDNGVGFDPRNQDQLFKVFWRQHSASEFPGIGMGLALVRKLIQRLGGQVSITAQPGAGCRTGFSLPVAAPAQ
jgi:two-component system, OmpR family, sensor kinase